MNTPAPQAPLADEPVLVMDDDPETAAMLVNALRSRGFVDVRLVDSVFALPSFLEDIPVAAVVNFHYEKPASLTATATIKQMAPTVRTLVICAPGLAATQANAWAQQTGTVDHICLKPLDDRGFFNVLRDVLEREREHRELEVRAARLAQRLPESARDTSTDPGADLGRAAEITEMAILVTDVRNSSGHIWSVPPKEYFSRINERLQAQASLVRKHRGAVLKFMGDGLIATFSGAGRHHLAVRCASALCQQDAELSAAKILRCGIGGAEGVVVTGYMGEPSHLQYDIIGSTVHLASRLCGLASPGEAMLTKDLYASARYAVDDAADVGELDVRGVGHPVAAMRLPSRRRPDQDRG